MLRAKFEDTSTYFETVFLKPILLTSVFHACPEIWQEEPCRDSK